MSLLDVVHCLDCSVGILILAITHEAETTATTGITILYNNLQYHNQTESGTVRWSRSYCFLDLTELFEFGAKSGVVGVPCKATVFILELERCMLNRE